MATTAAGTPYVESSDLVANYPGVSLALANHIDTIGKVLQVVRATDSTTRSTTSTSFVDASISVTITPQKNDSLILIIYSAFVEAPSNVFTDVQITNASNTAISGAENARFKASAGGTLQIQGTLIAYDSPATLSATTYKTRFKVQSGTGFLQNAINTAQMFAIEVSA